MKKLALAVLLLLPAIAIAKPHLYWASHCVMNHGPYPACWTGRKSADAQQCEMRHVKTSGGEHFYWMRCKDMQQTDMPPILSQREILAQTCNAERPSQIASQCPGGGFILRFSLY
jgi:hypothetical protein